MTNAGEQLVYTEHERSNRDWMSMLKGVALGALATVASGIAVGLLLDREGHIVERAPAVALPYGDDGVLRVATWNMHREAAKHLNEINVVMIKNKLDAFMLQEVTGQDAEVIGEAFKHKWSVTYEMADARQKPTDFGLGNMIITVKKPVSADSKHIAGNSLPDAFVKTIGGAQEDILSGNTSLTNAREGLQEGRVILSKTVQALGNMNIQFITTHLGSSSPSPEVHDQQMADLLKFVSDTKKKGQPTILCGDLNQGVATTVTAFAEVGMITREAAQPTTIDGGTTDYCIYRAGGKLGLMRTKVLKGFQTDHKVLYGEVRPVQAYKLAGNQLHNAG
ncbi:MAG: hypothetical protein JWO35_770 [Candidatus Saccharibacteria bacterium]|nr:hypothetical protein [Candidatus Saccharibacteria bacterium]